MRVCVPLHILGILFVAEVFSNGLYYPKDAASGTDAVRDMAVAAARSVCAVEESQNKLLTVGVLHLMKLGRPDLQEWVADPEVGDGW